MRKTTGFAATLAAAGLVAAGFMGPASAAPSNKGTTFVDPSDATEKVLVDVLRPGSLGKAGAAFGIVGNPKDGTIEHVGGLAIRAGSGAVLELRNFTIDLRDRDKDGLGVVTGIVNDSFRAPLFSFDMDDATDDDGFVTLFFTATASGAIDFRVDGTSVDITGAEAGTAKIVTR